MISPVVFLELKDPAVNPEVIITSAGRTTPGEDEPKLTLSQLESLFRAAADLERAGRPIVVHDAPQPAPAAQTGPAGASVYVPMPPSSAFTNIAVERPHNWWPLVYVVCGCTGLGSAVTAAATGNSIAILAVFASLAPWGASVFQLVFNRKG